MKTIDEKLAAVARLERLHEKKREAMEELKYSLEIERLVPDAFEHGSAQIRWTRRMKGGLNGYEYDGLITRGDGSFRIIPKGKLLPQNSAQLVPKRSTVHRKVGR